MNDARRKEIRRIIDALDNLKSDIEAVAEEEREYYDNMPEGIQAGEKGDRADEVATNLEEIASEMDTMLEALNNAAE